MRTPEETRERLGSLQIVIAELLGEHNSLQIDSMSVERIAVRLAEMRTDAAKAVCRDLLNALEQMAFASASHRKTVVPS